MPFTRRRRFNFRRRPFFRRNNYRGGRYGLATRPRMMPRALRFKRMNQVDTRVCYFKVNGVITANDQLNQYYEFRTSFLYAANPNGWAQYTLLYDQFKILGMTYRLYPSNVGTEPTAAGAQGPASTIHFNRGNHCIWNDQRWDPTVVQPTTIGQVINTASAKLINPRRPYTRSIWRPRGRYQWGATRAFTTTNPDPWTGSINHLINGATVQPQGQLKELYFYVLTFKVIFRGRQDD